MPPRRHLKWLPFRRKKHSFNESSSSTTSPADNVPSTNQSSSSVPSPTPSISSINQPPSSTIVPAPDITSFDRTSSLTTSPTNSVPSTNQPSSSIPSPAPSITSTTKPSSLPTSPVPGIPSTNEPPSSATSPAPSIPSIDQAASPTIPSTPSVLFTGTGDAADRVFHTLELAQQIVHELELGDLFRALPITKELWESKVPDRVWIDHLKRLGYPDYVIRNTSHCLRACYLSISQAVVGIRGGVTPVFRRTKMETIRKKRYMRSSCAQQMEPPFVLQSSHRHGGGDLYILDGDDLRLVKTDVLALPSKRVFNGSHVTATEDSESIAVRRLDNWSLTATYPNNPYSAEHTDSGTRDWHFYDKFIVSIYQPSVDEPIGNDLIEFWDQQGLKRGESIIDRWNSVPTSIHDFGDPNFSCLLAVYPYLRQTESLLPRLRCERMHYYSNQTDHYLTYVNKSHVKSWNLDTLEVVLEHSLSEDDNERGYIFAASEGVVFLGSLLEIRWKWTVDGRHISDEAAVKLCRNLCRASPLHFSDGCGISQSSFRVDLHDSEGDPIDIWWAFLSSGLEHYGILFDMFSFSLGRNMANGRGEDSVIRTLHILTKEGERCRTVHFKNDRRQCTWFIDILGRLVLIYEDADGYMEEWDTIDFRGVPRKT